MYHAPGATEEMWTNLFAWYDPPIHKEHRALATEYAKLKRSLEKIIQRLEIITSGPKADTEERQPGSQDTIGDH